MICVLKYLQEDLQSLHMKREWDSESRFGFDCNLINGRTQLQCTNKILIWMRKMFTILEQSNGRDLHQHLLQPIYTKELL